MKLKNKKILVTGADSFIGPHLAEEILKRGDNPWMLTPEEMGEIIRSLEVL